MSTTTTDAQLVTSFLAGDRGALAAIYDRYAPGLYDTAAAMLSDRHDASDMVQDVFCIAVERLGQLRDPERLKPWLYAVLRNEVYRRTKKRRRALPTDFTAEGVPDVVAPRDPSAEGESVEFEELASLVRSAAAGLDERDQLVLELSVRQGLTGADLADALGVSPEQSYSMVHRMRERVDKSIGAFIVARTGRKDCATLAEILRGWDGEFNVLVRKRVARHVEACAVCERKRGTVAPLALFAAAPAFVLPFGLREQVLAAATPLPGSTMPARSAHRARSMRFNRHNGFPRTARVARHVVAWGVGATTAVVLGAGGLVLATRDDGDTAPVNAPVVVATETPSTTATENSSTTAPDTTTSAPVTTATPIVPTVPPVTARPNLPPVTVPATVAPATPAPTTGAPATTVPVTVPVTAPATTKAPSTTKAPAPTTTVVAYRGAYLTSSAQSVQFGNTATSASFTITNPSPSSVNWTASPPAAWPALFTLTPASGTLNPGASVKVTVTFDRKTAADYANAASFPETANFSLSATVNGTAANGGSTSLTIGVAGKVVRPPLIRESSIVFSGPSCVNSTVVIRAVDESSVKSVTGTATLVNNDGTTASRSLTFTNQGDKIGWTAPVNDLSSRTVEVRFAAVVTDNIGLSTPVSLGLKRPTTC